MLNYRSSLLKKELKYFVLKTTTEVKENSSCISRTPSLYSSSIKNDRKGWKLKSLSEETHPTFHFPRNDKFDSGLSNIATWKELARVVEVQKRTACVYNLGVHNQAYQK